jgi:SAM-dependent methyltransferase
MAILDWLKLPEIKNIKDLDDPATTLLCGKILRSKPFLRNLYADFYEQFKNAVQQPEKKVLVELGSGGGFIKDVMPNVITSDILIGVDVDKVFSATDMPFEDAGVDAFFMFDVLHHINEPRKFFAEADRCLRPGGRIVMIEPANTLWARFVYKNFHHEGFDLKSCWELSKTGRLSQANDAIPWMVFVRDRAIFEREFPRLKVVSLRNHTPLRYLISGGLTLRQLLPGFAYPAVRAFEFLLSPANNLLGMFMTIIIERSNDGKPAVK